MSYRNPTIIQNQSGLIVPQAIAKAAENISQAWSKQLSDQRKLNLARKEEDRKNDLLVEQGTADAKASLKKGTGGKGLVDSAREAQVQIIDDLDEILKELNNRNLDPDRKKLLRATELELRNNLTDMNATFPKITSVMTDSNNFNINKAGLNGKVTPTTEDNLNFGLGLNKEGDDAAKYVYNGYKRNEDTGKLILDDSSSRGLTIFSGGVTVDANQFTSDGWTALTDVTQIQPDIDIAVGNYVFNAKKGLNLDTFNENATYETIAAKNDAGGTVGTQTVATRLATEKTNEFLNEQNQMAFAAIQAIQNPVETRNILRNQYSMTDKDIDVILNVKEANSAKFGGVTTQADLDNMSLAKDPANAHNKLRYAIARRVAGNVGIEITNPNEVDGPYTYAKVDRSGVTTPSEDKSTAYKTKLSDTMGLYTNAARVGQGQQRGSDRDVFLKASNLPASGKQISINGKKQRIDMIPFDENNPNMVSFIYGTPKYTGNAVTTVVDNVTYKAQDIEDAQKAMQGTGALNTLFLPAGSKTPISAHQFLTDAGLKNKNQIDIDMTNPGSVANAITLTSGLSDADALRIANTHFNN